MNLNQIKNRKAGQTAQDGELEFDDESANRKDGKKNSKKDKLMPIDHVKIK